MRRFPIHILLFLLVIPLAPVPLSRAETVASQPAPSAGRDARFARVLVFPGGGFQFAMFLGMLDALESQGRRPDVVIGTCGGGIAAAIATAIPTSAERRALVESEEFFRLLGRVKMGNTSLFSALARVWYMHRIGWFSDSLPNIFTETLLSVPPELSLPALDRPFASSGMRAVIIAARLAFGPSDAGKPRRGRKVYRQVYFTDPDTAQLLRGLQSPIAQLYPDSAVELETAVDERQLPMVAARLGVTDPYYVNPIALADGQYYLTGAIDIQPLETAHRLGREVFIPFSAGSGRSVERRAFLSTFQYDFNVRLRHGTSGQATYWIDTSDSAMMHDEYGFDPRLDVFSLSVKMRIPERFEEYRQKIRGQWEYGWQRAMEALGRPENSKAHIRMMDDTNTNRDVRCRLRPDECQEPIHQPPTS